MSKYEQYRNNGGYGDFSHKWINKKCTIVFSDGSTITGEVKGVEKFFIELYGEDGRYSYINKAYIREIIPLNTKNNEGK